MQVLVVLHLDIFLVYFIDMTNYLMISVLMNDNY